MSEKVQRFLLKASATAANTKYYPWTIVNLSILIGEDDKNKALEKAQKLILKNCFIPISSIHKSTLIEELVLSNPELVDIYLEIKAGKNYFTETTDSWTGFKNSPPLLFPKITERFIDKVIEHAGGKRFEYQEESQQLNADYIVAGHILELKLIEEERLTNYAVQNKLAELLYDFTGSDVEVSHNNLSEQDYSLYTNIFRTPIQNAVKSASKQINSTKELENNHNLHGGLLIINNGTSSLTPKVFHDCVNKSVKNNTNNIQSVLSISCWCQTDGFNVSFDYSIKPGPLNELEERLRNSFNEVVHDFLTDWAKSGFQQNAEMLKPLQTITFERHGIVFVRPGQYNQGEII